MVKQATNTYMVTRDLQESAFILKLMNDKIIEFQEDIEGGVLATFESKELDIKKDVDRALLSLDLLQQQIDRMDEYAKQFAERKRKLKSGMTKAKAFLATVVKENPAVEFNGKLGGFSTYESKGKLQMMVSFGKKTITNILDDATIQKLKIHDFDFIDTTTVKHVNLEKLKTAIESNGYAPDWAYIVKSDVLLRTKPK